MKSCSKCGALHEKNSVFCSRSCANSRVISDSSKKLISTALSNKNRITIETTKKQRVPRIIAMCASCSGEFEKTEKSNQKYCSVKCSSANHGGYRNGSGKAKTGYYKGIYCGSTYELVWVIFQMDNNIPFSRFPGTLEFEGRKYIPDFIQDGVIIEIKGYEDQDSVDRKTLVANANGYTVRLLRRDDLTAEFEWVKRHHIHKNLEELYDNYSPKFEYSCVECGTAFVSNKEKRLEPVCSRKCSALLARKKRHNPSRKSNKLSKAQVLEIFKNNSVTNDELASQFSISKSMVSSIKSKRCYAWVHE